jgi:hypothetical protein
MKKLPMHGKDKQIKTDGSCGMTEDQLVNKEFSGKKRSFSKITENLKKKK